MKGICAAECRNALLSDKDRLLLDVRLDFHDIIEKCRQCSNLVAALVVTEHTFQLC